MLRQILLQVIVGCPRTCIATTLTATFDPSAQSDLNDPCSTIPSLFRVNCRYCASHGGDIYWSEDPKSRYNCQSQRGTVLVRFFVVHTCVTPPPHRHRSQYRQKFGYLGL